MDRLRAWLEGLLWDDVPRGPAREALRLGLVTVWKFDADRGLLRASALTFTTLLSLVPFLAILFALLKGLGGHELLKPLLVEHLAVGNEALVDQILTYVDRTKVGALGAVGLITLLLTAVSVLGNAERSLNDIWQVRRGRSFIRKVADYTALLVVAPVLLLAIVSANATLQSPAVLDRLSVVAAALPPLLAVAPYALVWLLFTAFYLILPNRTVPLGAALLGGAVAGAAWQVAELLYLRFQFGLGRYNAIYGALAQLPLLMAWVYLSWCLVLLGAELAFLWQSPGRGRRLRGRLDLWVPRLDAALALLLAVARRFEEGKPAPREDEVVAEVGLDPGESPRLVERLVEVGLLALTHDDPPGLLPARAPDRTPLIEVLGAVARLGDGGGAEADLVARVRLALGRELAGETWGSAALAGRTP